jgi:biopolymer transport protein ExbD
MRPFVCALLVLIGAGLPAFGADPAPRLSVEVRADRDAKFTTVATVLAAVRQSERVPARLTLRVQEAEGISARIRVSPEIPYGDLDRLLDTLTQAGVGRIILTVK